MIKRLTLKDSFQKWVDKFNEMLDLNVVDGNFTIEDITTESEIKVRIGEGIIRRNGSILKIEAKEFTLTPASNFSLSINPVDDTYEVVLTSPDNVPITSVPLYNVSTNNVSITSIEDSRTWVDFRTKDQTSDPSQVTYAGTWDASSNMLPSTPQNSSYWMVVGADEGYEVSGEIYYTNDILLYSLDGSSPGLWSKINNRDNSFWTFSIDDNGDLIATY